MKRITKEELEVFLRKHKLWLDGKEGGERANLRSANLRYANLRYADLSYADLSYANLRYADLRSADLSSANLRSADLRSADLRSANLRSADLRSADLSYANLRYADLDFSAFPLWCGSLDVHLDDKQLKQIAYHLVRNGLYSKNASEETKEELSKIIDFANEFHRVEECGMIGGAKNE